MRRRLGQIAFGACFSGAIASARGMSLPPDYDVSVTRGSAAGTYTVHLSGPSEPNGKRVVAVDAGSLALAVLDASGTTIAGGDRVRLVGPIRTTPGDPLFEADATYRVDAPLALGMNSVIARVGPEALRDDSGATVAAHIVAFPLHEYDAPLPDRAPTLERGQRFIAAPIEGTGSAHAVAIAVHPVTLERVRGHRLTLSTSTGETFSIETDEGAMHVPGLVPIVRDPEAELLEARYAGKTVASIGAATLDCLSTGNLLANGSVSSNAVLQVQHVYRIARDATAFDRIGSREAADDRSGFVTDRPLLAVLDVPKTTRFGATSYAWSGPASTPFDLHDRCVAFTMQFAGAWDFERALSLQTLERAHPEWSPALRAHVLAREVRVGMTHDAVAWMFGYPPTYGTRSDLERLARWDYSEPAPFAFAVAFRGDGVTAYDPPGELP